MKAAVVKGKRRLEVEEVPTPEVLPGTLLLKTKYCAICGSDLEYLDGSLAVIPNCEIHAGAIIGHEWVAEIAAVGEGVKGWSVGDRVGVGMAQTTCGECYFCRHGLYHLCVGGSSRASVFEVLGYETIGGGFGEYFLRPPNAVQKVPDGLSSEEAVFAEPLCTGLGAVEAAGLKPGDSAVIIGAGKIGLGALLCAKAAGVAPIIVIDILKNRLDTALEMGAAVVLNAKEVDVVSEVVKLTDAGPDAVLICVRHAGVVNQAVDIVRRGGNLVTAGIMATQEVDPRNWVVKQIKITAILGGSITASMSLIAHKLVNVKPLISEIIPLEDIQRGLDSVYSGENIGVLVKP